jgi:hypothetical protein
MKIEKGESKMKKSLLGILIVAVVVFALAITGVVHAQSNTPTYSTTQTDYGFGGHGGMMGGRTGIDQDGLLHDAMIAAFAEKLGISVEDLNARLASGETMYSIAKAEGLTDEEFATLMVDTRNQAIDQAVTNGTLTQAQADWMKTRSNMMGSGSFGMRGANGSRGTNFTGSCMGFD